MHMQNYEFRNTLSSVETCHTHTHLFHTRWL